MKRHVIALAGLLVAGPVFGHDIYSQVYEKNGLPGQSRLCCGGDEKRGDCEGLDSDRIHETPDGVYFLSRRYGAQVFVPKHRIHWDGPRTNGTMQLADPLNRPAHWCGRPRMDTDGAPNDDNPDPRFITFCAFMLPGGV